MSKIPKEQYILDRCKTLASGVKSKKKRTQILAGEVRQLWKNLTLPIQQGKSTVERKIENVIKQYERHSRRPGNYDFTKLFNVTDEKGEWLCQEDREFYKLQMSTEGKVGYCSRKEGNKAIHPRKMKSFKRKVTEASVAEEIFDDDTEEISESEESVHEEQLPSSDEDFGKPSTSKKTENCFCNTFSDHSKVKYKESPQSLQNVVRKWCFYTYTQSKWCLQSCNEKRRRIKKAFRRKLKT